MCKQERLQNLISPSQAVEVLVYFGHFFFEYFFFRVPNLIWKILRGEDEWVLSLLGYTKDRITDKFHGSKTRYQVKTRTTYCSTEM